MKQLSSIFLAFAVGFVILGCNSNPREENINVKADPVGEARAVLQRYADGQPLASEASSFPKLIERVKAANAEQGATVEKALNDIQKAPGNRTAIAKDALAKLPQAK